MSRRQGAGRRDGCQALTPAADGYTVAGPAVPAGRDASYLVKTAKLPTDTTRLPFKTLQTYSDGRIDRWIEVPAPGQTEPDKPAPVLTVAAAPAPAVTSASPSPTSPRSSAQTAATSNPATTGADDRTDSFSDLGWLSVAAVLAVAVVAGTGIWWVRRRRPRQDGA